MKSRSIKRFIQSIAVLVIAVSMTGCASTRAYFVDRGRDAKDVFTCSFGEGYGVKLRAGPCQVGLEGNTDYCGLRAGEFFVVSQFPYLYDGGGPERYISDIEFGPLAYVVVPILIACTPQFSPPHWDYDTGEDEFLLPGSTDLRAKNIKAKNFLCIITQDSLSHYSQIEAVGGFVWTVRLGFNPGELLDFLLGWFGIDIFKDDLAMKELKKEQREAPARLKAAEEAAAKLKRQQMMEELRLAALRSTPPVHIYGRVVDQFGTPVFGAKCTVSYDPIVSPASPRRSVCLEANTNGCWEYHQQEGGVPEIASVERAGYLSAMPMNPCFAATNKNELIRATSKENPLTFRLWKQTHLAFDDCRHELFRPTPPQQVDMWIDLFRREVRVSSVEDGVTNSAFSPELHIQVTYVPHVSKSRTLYDTQFLCQTCDNGDGIAVVNHSQEEIREAPESGYEREACWSVKGPPWARGQKDIFVRISNPTFYALVRLESVKTGSMSRVTTPASRRLNGSPGSSDGINPTEHKPPMLIDFMGPYTARILVNPFGNRNMTLQPIPQEMQQRFNTRATESLLNKHVLESGTDESLSHSEPTPNKLNQGAP